MKPFTIDELLIAVIIVMMAYWALFSK